MNETEQRAAKQDIAEVVVRYATGIDRRDWDRFRSCFTEDVHADYEGVAIWDGVEEITQFMIDAHAGMGHTMHRITNIAIDLDGDRAAVRSYVAAVLMLPDGSGLRPMGFYDDDFVRTDAGWRIKARRYTPVHFEVLGG